MAIASDHFLSGLCLSSVNIYLLINVINDKDRTPITEKQIPGEDCQREPICTGLSWRCVTDPPATFSQLVCRVLAASHYSQ
jgi:hypothetical protein